MLAALLRRSETIIAIPGTGASAHLRDNVEAYGLELDDLELESIWEYYRPVGLPTMRRADQLRARMKASDER